MENKKKKIFQFVDLGIIDYEAAWDKQNEQVKRSQQGAQDAVFLCEHPAVITLGRTGKRENLLLWKEIQSRGIKVIDVDRGGDVTLHAPGQLIVYPIIDLCKYGKNLKSYLAKLEQVAIDFFREFDILTERKNGKTGVWIGSRKIVSIGIGVKKWISFHGMSLNINTDLSLFSFIRPCGLDVQMTSLEENKKARIDLENAKVKFADIFRDTFMREEDDA